MRLLSPLFLRDHHTDRRAQLGYGVRSALLAYWLIVVFIRLGSFFLLLCKATKKTRDGTGDWVWANRCTTGPCLYIIHSFGCFSTHTRAHRQCAPGWWRGLIFWETAGVGVKSIARAEQNRTDTSHIGLCPFFVFVFLGAPSDASICFHWLECHCLIVMSSAG